MLNKIKQAFKANIKPAIYLQIVALAIALSYFFVPASAPFFNFLAYLKTTYGVSYAVISTSIFGGLLPYLLMLLTKQIHFRPIAQLFFYCIFWAFMGAVIDSFYQYQAYLFGSDNQVSTIIKKVLFDQFVFNIVFAAPFTALCFLFRDSQFKVDSWLSGINKQFFTEDIPVVLISTWIIWIPAVTIIYAMPSNLQIPLFNIVLCMFVLILAILNKPNEAERL